MRKNIYAPICVYHFAIHQKLTQHCKSTKLQQQKKPKQRYSPALSSVRLLSHVRLCDPMDCSTPASLSITNSWSLLKFMSIELLMPSNHLILCRPLFPPSIFPGIRVFSSESVFRIKWPKYWSFSFSISPSNKY